MAGMENFMSGFLYRDETPTCSSTTTTVDEIAVDLPQPLPSASGPDIRKSRKRNLDALTAASPAKRGRPTVQLVGFSPVPGEGTSQSRKVKCDLCKKNVSFNTRKQHMTKNHKPKSKSAGGGGGGGAIRRGVVPTKKQLHAAQLRLKNMVLGDYRDNDPPAVGHCVGFEQRRLVV